MMHSCDWGGSPTLPRGSLPGHRTHRSGGGPKQIIAFGSRARGQLKPDSDLDPLVVLPRGAGVAGVAAIVYAAVGAPGFSKDILISEEERFERSRSSLNSVQGEAAREGVSLYENGRADRAAIERICR